MFGTLQLIDGDFRVELLHGDRQREDRHAEHLNEQHARQLSVFHFTLLAKDFTRTNVTNRQATENQHGQWRTKTEGQKEIDVVELAAEGGGGITVRRLQTAIETEEHLEVNTDDQRGDDDEHSTSDLQATERTNRRRTRTRGKAIGRGPDQKPRRAGQTDVGEKRANLAEQRQIGGRGKNAERREQTSETTEVNGKKIGHTRGQKVQRTGIQTKGTTSEDTTVQHVSSRPSDEKERRNNTKKFQLQPRKKTRRHHTNSKHNQMTDPRHRCNLHPGSLVVPSLLPNYVLTRKR